MLRFVARNDKQLSALLLNDSYSLVAIDFKLVVTHAVNAPLGTWADGVNAAAAGPLNNNSTETMSGMLDYTHSLQVQQCLMVTLTAEPCHCSEKGRVQHAARQ